MESYITKIDYIEKLLLEDEGNLAKEKLQELKNTIIYDIAIKNCGRNNNKKEQLKSAKEFLKNSKTLNKSRILFHKIYKFKDTYQLCDGFTAVVLNDMINGLELNTAEDNYFNCRNVIDKVNLSEYEEVKIDMLDLEQKAIAVKKLKNNIIPAKHLFHINNLYYNPTYVLRAIKILGTEKIRIYAHSKNNKEPIYLKSELGEAIVLSILVHED